LEIIINVSGIIGVRHATRHGTIPLIRTISDIARSRLHNIEEAC